MIGRSIVRVVLWLVLLTSIGIALLFVAVIVFGADSETRLGGLVFAAGAGTVAMAARTLLERLPPRRKSAPAAPEPLAVPDDVEGEVVLAGSGLFRKRISLRLAPDGFEAKTLRGVVHRSWDDVEGFRVVKVGGSRTAGGIPTVGYTLRDHGGRARRLARWVTGVDMTIPTVELPASELAELMERYRQRYATTL